ncbi:olfactory receptor 6C1-like [Ranitomeya variabilis]|uniref:olfactory receptor 6C1-like n=1 Tax=Ranitomeya variabilis TaxID=490064 RepID=UPI0040563B86
MSISNPFLKHVRTYLRFADDIFIIWDGSRETFDSFVTHLNNVNDENMQFTACYGGNSLEFLDVKIDIVKGELNTRVYKKSTATNSVLHFNSAHPAHTKKSIPYSQMVRYRKLNNNETVFNEQLSELKNNFLKRKYPSNILLTAEKRVKQLKQKDLLKYRKRENQLLTSQNEYQKFVFSFTHSPVDREIHSAINKNWHVLQSDRDLAEITVNHPRFAYKRTKNLGDLLNSNSLENVGFHNQTSFTYFIILGISQVPELQALVFLLVLILYLITVTGNMTLLLLVCLETHLHTPMYFFLGNLSFLDVFCLTITLHKILLSYMSGDKTVSFTNCMSQMYIFSSLTCNELLILTAMSYDRYVAICNPLHYHMIMNRKICVLSSTVCWALGFVEVIPHMLAISRFSCYKSNVINHYFCDILPIMKLSCSDTTLLRLIIFIEGLFLVSFTPFLLTFISYVFIIVTILRIRSSSGRRKAFYTCSSHLTVVIILYVSLVCQYLRPSSTDTLDSNKLFSLFNTAAVPVLNPFIYSLKNKDVKSAARKQLKRLTI